MSAKQQNTVDCLSLSNSWWYNLGSQLLNAVIIGGRRRGDKSSYWDPVHAFTHDDLIIITLLHSSKMSAGYKKRVHFSSQHCLLLSNSFWHCHGREVFRVVTIYVRWRKSVGW